MNATESKERVKVKHKGITGTTFDTKTKKKNKTNSNGNPWNDFAFSIGKKTAWLVQAVKALGKGKKDKSTYDSLMGDFSPVEKKKIRAEIRGAAAWIRKTLLQMLDDGSDTVEENQ